jgi:putative ABC transport system substrate-binding protein
MRRRDLLALIGSTAVSTRAALAQQRGVPIVGLLYAGAEAAPPLLAAFRNGLGETGFVEGRNLAVEHRSANNALERLPALAADLVRQRVAAIATPGSYQAALAAKAATSTIPIIFSTGIDAVRAGLVASVNRPGGNVTGVNYLQAELAAKQFGLLHELLPRATRFAVLVNPDNPVVTDAAVAALRSAASTSGVQAEVLRASTADEIDSAFAGILKDKIEGLLVSPGPLFGNRRVQLVTLAARYAVPTMFYDREFADAGGLISYGTSLTDQYRETGRYTGRVLKGENPAEMPVMQATRFELVLNLTTAKSLGLDVPATLLSNADAVIE